MTCTLERVDSKETCDSQVSNYSLLFSVVGCDIPLIFIAIFQFSDFQIMEQLNKEDNARLIRCLEDKIQGTEKKLQEHKKLEKEFLPIWNSASASDKCIGKSTAMVAKSKEELVKNKLVDKLFLSNLNHQKRKPNVDNRFRAVIKDHGIIINPLFAILEREASRASGASESEVVEFEDGEKEEEISEPSVSH